jgi:hypothetical protein
MAAVGEEAEGDLGRDVARPMPVASAKAFPASTDEATPGGMNILLLQAWIA